MPDADEEATGFAVDVDRRVLDAAGDGVSADGEELGEPEAVTDVVGGQVHAMSALKVENCRVRYSRANGNAQRSPAIPNGFYVHRPANWLFPH